MTRLHVFALALSLPTLACASTSSTTQPLSFTPAHRTLTSSAPASPTPDSDEFEKDLEKLYGDLSSAIVKQLEASGAAFDDLIVIDNIEFVVEDDPAWFTGAVSDIDNSKIIISTGYAAGLYNHVMARVLENLTGRSDLAEHHWRHFGDSVLYDDMSFVPLVEFAGLTAQQRQQLESDAIQQAIATGFYGALGYSMAHEIGHHVIAREQPQLRGPEREAACDDWAAKALLMTGVPPLEGAGLSFDFLGVLDEAGDLLTEEKDRTHPYSIDRAATVMAAYVDQTEALYHQAGLAPDQVAAYMASQRELVRNVEAQAQSRARERQAHNYEQAALDQRDAKKLHMLALMYRNGVGVSANAQRANAFAGAAAMLGHPRAQMLSGSFILSGQPSEADQLLAYALYGAAATAGLKTGKVYSELLRKDQADTLATEMACIDRLWLQPLEQCHAERRQVCVQACIQNYGNPPNQCRNFFCASERQRQQEFVACHGNTVAPIQDAVASCG